MIEELVYKKDNQNLFQNYLNFFENKLQNYIPEIPENSDYYASLFELRCLTELRPIIKNHLYFLNKNNLGIKWGLQIFHGSENEEFIKELLKDFNNVVYENLNIQNFKDRQTHTKILKTTDFWKKSKGEKILMFQNDSMLLKSGIEEFLKWDYIGAPWKTPKEGCLVGNGGLSLRTKDKMIEITEKYESDNGMWEDIYFSKYTNGDGLADIESARKFAMEDDYYHDPMGIHNPIKIETKLLKQIFEKNVPEYSI
jgi:hypothetical protein